MTNKKVALVQTLPNVLGLSMIYIPEPNLDILEHRLFVNFFIIKVADIKKTLGATRLESPGEPPEEPNPKVTNRQRVLTAVLNGSSCQEYALHVDSRRRTDLNRVPIPEEIFKAKNILVPFELVRPKDHLRTGCTQREVKISWGSDNQYLSLPKASWMSLIENSPVVFDGDYKPRFCQKCVNFVLKAEDGCSLDLETFVCKEGIRGQKIPERPNNSAEGEYTELIQEDPMK